MIISVSDIVKAVNGRLLGPDAEDSSKKEKIEAITVDHICMDSRIACEKDIFVPLVGTQVDAHRFISDVMDKAYVTFTDRELEGYKAGRAYIKVDDTLKALQMLGGYVRSLYKKPVIAVTGSVGKTTTREMITTALEAGFKVYHTEKNFNSESGTPITLFGMNDVPSDLAVLELGISNFGEMDALAEIARPDIAVVTTIGEAHQEFFKTLENTRTEKLKVASRMDSNGLLFINADDPMLAAVKDSLPVETLSYGTAEGADFRAVNITHDDTSTTYTLVAGGKEVDVTIPLLGNHNVVDSVVAMAIAAHMGIEAEAAAAALSKFSGQRQNILTADQGFKIIDDTYNASPISMESQLVVLNEMKTSGRRVAVLGDMFELGDDSAEHHARVGRFMKSLSIDILVTVGELSKNISDAADDGRIEIHHFTTNDEAANYLKDNLFDGDTVLFKASHGMHFENIVETLCKVSKIS